MGVLSWRGLVIPKFSAPTSDETMRQTVRPPTALEMQERARGPLPPCQVWWGSDFTRSGQKRWVLFVCLSVCPSRFWTLKFVRPISPWRHWTTETILISLHRRRFVVVHLCSTFSDSCQLVTPLNAEVQNSKNWGFFANSGRQNKAIEAKFGRVAYTVGLL